jgi:hypothetical protein
MAASSGHSMRTRRSARAARSLCRSPGRGDRLPDLGGGEGPRGQTRIAETDLDLDNAVAADPRAHSKRQVEEGELEMRDLQPLRRDGNFPIGGKGGPAKAPAKCLPGFESGDNEKRSLNPEHCDLFKEQDWTNTARKKSGCGLTHLV